MLHPAVRYACGWVATLPGAVAANRIANDGSSDRDTLCFGPVCMMWRWHTYNHGYCGVAGKPLPMEDIRNDHD